MLWFLSLENMKCSEIFKSKGLLCTAALLIYIILGSVIFVQIERPDESSKVVASRMFTSAREKLSRQFGVNITTVEFMDLVGQIEDALAVQARSEWTYRSTVDWLTISLTTIGYGNVVPRTPLGQGIFIIYALFGLPLAMITLKNTGELLSLCIFRFIQMVEKKVFGKDEPACLKLKTLIVSLLAFITVHGYGAVTFMRLQNTTFLEGVYASFITLSTIGFGDYALQLRISDTPNVGDSVVRSLYLPFMIFNLSIVSCFLNSIMNVMESVRGRNEISVQDTNNNDIL